MFNNPARPDPSYEEGTVTEVDVIRQLCKVKTLTGQNLNAVAWPQPSGGSSRGGDRVTPLLGDLVKVHTGLGRPVIASFLPRLQNEENIFPTRIDSGDVLVDTGSFSPAGGAIVADQNAPKDMLVGDRVISSQGGGMLGILRGGSVLLRSSRLAEIFLSKWDDSVRIVSRNFQHFTDVSSVVVQNVSNRVYSYFGASKEFKETKIEDYKYHQYTGDVALAEKAKTQYTLVTEAPEKDDRIYKEQITKGSGSESKELMRRELHLDGTHDLVVVDILDEETGEVYTRIRQTKDEVFISWKDENIIKINKDQINLTKKGDPTINMDDTGIKCTFKDGTVYMKEDGIFSTYKGGEVNIVEDGVHATKEGGEVKVIADGIHATKSGGEMKVTSSEVSLTKGGHFVKVGAGGVSLG